MFYKDKKEIFNFLGGWVIYVYIFLVFFNFKINMKIGYFFLIVLFFYICFNRNIIKLVNKKIYGMFLLILVLGFIWNYILVDMIGMSKFFNINIRFFYGFVMFLFLLNIKKNRFSILIFLVVNLFSVMYLYNESYVYYLFDDLGRIRVILLIGWIYILIYIFEKIFEDFKKYIFLLLVFILFFIVLGKSGSRVGVLLLFFVIFLYFIFKVFKEKKSIKFVFVIIIIILFIGLFLFKEYKEKLKILF